MPAFIFQSVAYCPVSSGFFLIHVWEYDEMYKLDFGYNYLSDVN